MTEPVRITLPADAAALRALPSGTGVLLSGTVFTARDATHARLVAELERDGVLPYGLAGATLFYACLTPPAAGRPAGAVGPTTAARMDAWTPRLLAAGIVATIGKGARSEAVRRACVETGAVYLAAIGGAAALLATKVVSATPVAYLDLGTEALVRMELDEFPVWVSIDAAGHDLYAESREEWADVGERGVSGLFITFEGGDGSGKSTQIQLLASRLCGLGFEVRTFREPGGVEPGDAGERMREILLDPAHMNLDVRAELLLMVASRAQLVAAHYRPALTEGAIVLCDRYADSSVAYQGYGRAVLPVEEVHELNRIATGGLGPDLTLLLDVDASAGLEQATADGADRLEQAGREFHERVREGYLAIADNEPDRVKLIGRASVEDVAAAIWSHVEPLLSRVGRA